MARYFVRGVSLNGERTFQYHFDSESDAKGQFDKSKARSLETQGKVTFYVQGGTFADDGTRVPLWQWRFHTDSPLLSEIEA